MTVAFLAAALMMMGCGVGGTPSPAPLVPQATYSSCQTTTTTKSYSGPVAMPQYLGTAPVQVRRGFFYKLKIKKRGC